MLEVWHAVILFSLQAAEPLFRGDLPPRRVDVLLKPRQQQVLLHRTIRFERALAKSDMVYRMWKLLM